MFEYFISDETRPVKNDGEEWQKPFPINRDNSHASIPAPLTYGDYFLAVRQFLEKDNFVNLVSAASVYLKKNISPEAIKGVSVFLEKHGEYYHPSRIEALISGRKTSFALNVALTDSGVGCMEKEYKSLMLLNQETPNSFIPDVFKKGFVYRKNRKISMFIGEWFEKYNEFHISVTSNADKAIIVWDPVLGNYKLSKNQEKELYRQASKILTFFYNPETCSKIHSWHHAAGDFVIKREDDKIDVKLITVRQYESPFEEKERETEQDIRTILDGLFVFFLNLSIRMCIDRTDGTGAFVWSGDTAVKGMIQGFFDGLGMHTQAGMNFFSLTESFKYYLSLQQESDLHDLADDIVSSYHPAAPDKPVVESNIKKHIKVLYKETKKLSIS
ncbi:MAG: hypothetical protein JRI91_03470 [Deltaproteobacteria bacterium]|nr:hypothetical protein [Deltaproteobacteria bacterium]